MIIDLQTFKGYMRVLDGDLDLALQLALSAAEAEASSFIGAELSTLGPDLPGDVVMAIVVLAQVHADAGTVQESEWRRTAAHNLLRPHRLATGIGGIA